MHPHPGDTVGPKDALRRLASALPLAAQQALKRRRFASQIRAGSFTSDEPEFAQLARWVTPGDWVVDVGANVGHYTVALARLVGDAGRVLAMEPVPETFELLVANVAAAGCRNATLLNAAASSSAAVAGMRVPLSRNGVPNYYQSRLEDGAGDVRVLCLNVDRLELPGRVSLVKVDAEGHEAAAIAGMTELLARHSPRLIVEDTSRDVSALIESLGYRSEKLTGSPNRIWTVQ